MRDCLEATGYLGFSKDFVVPKKADYLPRFSMLVCGMFCSIAIGALYAYSLITGKLTAEYHFTQNDITTISTVGIVIGYFTFPFGIVYDYFGPKPIFAIGILCNLIGTLLFALTFNEQIGHSVGGLAIINAVMNLGCAMFDMGSILTVLSWFPLDRGLVVACMKTTTGLGGSFVSTLYGTFFNNNNSTYMFFLLAYSAFIGTIAIFVIYLPPFHMTGLRMKQFTADEHKRAAEYQTVYMKHKAPLKRFIIAFCLVISLLIVICTRAVVFVFIEKPTSSQKNPPTIIMIVLYVLFLFTLTPWKWLDKQPGSYDKENRERAEVELQEDEQGALCDDEVVDNDDAGGADDGISIKKIGAAEALPDVTSALDDDVPSADPMELKPSTAEDDAEKTEATPRRSLWRRLVDSLKSEKPPAAEEKPPQTRAEMFVALRKAIEAEKIAPQFPTGFVFNLRRVTLWCLWITGFCVSGAVNVILLNSTQIYYAVSEDPSDQTRPSLYVALTSIGSAVGRLIMAFTEVGTQSQPPEKRVPITVFYCIPPILCVLSCILFLFVPTAGLLAPMLLGGLGNGFYAAAEVLTVRTIFSLDVAKHYNSLFFAEMLAVIFMNRLLFGGLMTKNSVVTASGVPQCLGRKRCIQTTFIVLTCLSAFGLAASIVMHITYFRFAKQEFAKRRQLRRSLEEKLGFVEGDVSTPSHFNDLDVQRTNEHEQDEPHVTLGQPSSEERASPIEAPQ